MTAPDPVLDRVAALREARSILESLCPIRSGPMGPATRDPYEVTSNILALAAFLLDEDEPSTSTARPGEVVARFTYDEKDARFRILVEYPDGKGRAAEARTYVDAVSQIEADVDALRTVP